MAEVAIPDEPVLNIKTEFAARVGICVLNFPEGTEIRDVYKKLIGELKQDPRIEDLQVAPTTTAQFRETQFPASGLGGDRDSSADTLPINPHRHIHVAGVTPPIRLHVKVPRRVQSTRESGVPTDEYWAIWDGVTIAIGWRYEDSPRPFGDAGGRVVLDVLKEAADKAGAAAVSEPCGPNCSYPFAHAKLSLRSSEKSSSDLTFSGTGASAVDVFISGMSGIEDALTKLFAQVSFAGWCFASMRSESRTMQEIDEFARNDLTTLLSIYYGSVTRKFSFRRQDFRRWWSQRKWASTANKLIARLWLAVATIEGRRLDWTNVKFVYDGFATRTGVGVVFESEYAQDVNVINHIDISGIKSAIDHASSRLDTKSLAFATTVAAVVGALVGVIVGAIITSL